VRLTFVASYSEIPPRQLLPGAETGADYNDEDGIRHFGLFRTLRTGLLTIFYLVYRFCPCQGTTILIKYSNHRNALKAARSAPFPESPSLLELISLHMNWNGVCAELALAWSR
jgi:hypothetical protein